MVYPFINTIVPFYGNYTTGNLCSGHLKMRIHAQLQNVYTVSTVCIDVD